MSRNNLYVWLEAEQAAAAQAPQSDPNAAGGVGSPPQQQPASPPNPGEDPSAGAQDVTQDPESMDHPPEADGDKDYEQWKHDFMEAAIKCDNEELINMLNVIRERNLDAPQRKFV